LRWRKSGLPPPLVRHVSGIERIIRIQEPRRIDHQCMIFSFGVYGLSGNPGHSGKLSRLYFHVN
jgi:hypothetical protein